MRKFGLIGYPLTHSFSPAYFAQKFDSLGIQDARYDAYPLESLADFKIWFHNQNLSGVNVTIPFKSEIIPYLDQLDPLAASVGAVNCVARVGEQLIGYNTDVDGFARSIVPFVENKYERALIIGTGGASKAVAYALERWGIAVFFLSRNPNAPNHLGYDALTNENIAFFPLIINCSPLGSFPLVDGYPEIPYHALSAQHFLYDLTYNPEQTVFMKKALEYGALTMNGLKMLEIQADLSWQIWNTK